MEGVGVLGWLDNNKAGWIIAWQAGLKLGGRKYGFAVGSMAWLVR